MNAYSANVLANTDPGYGAALAASTLRRASDVRIRMQSPRVQERLTIVRKYGPRGTLSQNPCITASWLDSLETLHEMRQMHRALDLAQQLGIVPDVWPDHNTPGDVIEDILPELERHVALN